jgi:phosphoribosylamine--glycine ligase
MLFGWAQDHKRAFDGDEGPNTGGMGTYSPAPVFTYDLVEQTRTRLVEPAFKGIAADGSPYRGVLFVELMATRHGPKLIEFNARFGDPETQVVLDRLDQEGTPLAPLLHAAAAGDLAGAAAPRWRPGAAVVVVIAAEGYPEHPVKGDKIKIMEPERALVTSPGDPGSPTGEAYLLHAGTAIGQAGAGGTGELVSAGGTGELVSAGGTGELVSAGGTGELVSAGGRVLNAVGSGPDIAAARARAYALAATIELRGGWYRCDIAARL